MGIPIYRLDKFPKNYLKGSRSNISLAVLFNIASNSLYLPLLNLSFWKSLFEHEGDMYG